MLAVCRAENPSLGVQPPDIAASKYAASLLASACLQIASLVQGKSLARGMQREVHHVSSTSLCIPLAVACLDLVLGA